MKIVTAAEMREIDRLTSEKFGVPSLKLMENAGMAVAEFVRERYPQASRIAVICGKGNNGGDGFVAARHLHLAGKVVEVLLLASSDDLKGDAAEMFDRLPVPAVEVVAEAQLQVEFARSFARSDLFLDAVLGTGFKPPVSPLYAAAIRLLNAAKAPIVAIDVPSGSEADGVNPQAGDDIVRADAAVTFTAPKPVNVFGDLVRMTTAVAPIGSPEEAIKSTLGLQVITVPDFAKLLAKRPLDSNKGMYGHALIFAGSFGKSGAAAMAGMACLRSGAGLATIATPKSVLTSVAGYAPELMTEPLPETDAGTIAHAALDRWDELTNKMTVLAIGPGLTQNSETVEFVREALRRAAIPTVIDADGLNALDGHTELLKEAKAATIITPHPGEMARLCGTSVKTVQADRIGIAREFAASRNTIVVLKGYKTVVASPSGEVWINCTGNPGMATGGTGDVLTGITAGLLAQYPQEPLFCAIAAVHLHGLAGDAAKDHVGEMSLMATDLIHLLPETLRRAKKSLQKRLVTLN
jgi:ADP-dependent NAD(P)H-hydrate dehydratase / NAD(P)H-hydrate epimerase